LIIQFLLCSSDKRPIAATDGIRGAMNRAGENETSVLNAHTALDGSPSAWGEPCGIRLFGKRRYARSYENGKPAAA